MTWRVEWAAISSRISGLIKAGNFYIRGFKGSDSFSIATRELAPNIGQVFSSLQKYHDAYGSLIPTSASKCLEGFLFRSKTLYVLEPHYTPDMTFEYIKSCIAALSSFQTEFDYCVSDVTVAVKRLSERAFLHLKRSIVADHIIRERWIDAYNEGEVACEKLGAAHLLLHGIWAFKVNSQGERTDLVFSEPLLNLTEVQNTAEALVLTEWKIVKRSNDIHNQIRKAYNQAMRYSCGSLAGLELAAYRYLIIVSENVLPLVSDLTDGEITYRIINIAVNPKPPSK